MIAVYIVFGILAGVLGGMGMGGGTILIPLLTIFLILIKQLHKDLIYWPFYQ